MRIEDTISVTEAAKLKGVTRQSIFYAIQSGDIRVLGNYGSSKMLSRADVEAYKPRKKKDDKGKRLSGDKDEIVE